MLPIAVLPAAALLLRFGQADLLDLPFMASAGAAIFDNLGILFSIGIAVGYARENNGAAGLAGVVGYFVIIKGAGALLHVSPDLAGNTAAYLATEASRMSIPVGIVAGLTAGLLYNRFYTIRLPDYLAFFGGRRFVPIIAGLVCLGWAVLFGKTWPLLSAGLDSFSKLLSSSGEGGLFLYGVFNRILIVTGLHHILNNVVWFLHGAFSLVQDGATIVITGDLNRFSRGDPTAGAFMAGFFPVMMFGLPAACLAMYRNALPSAKRTVGGVLVSMALTSFITGITEPVEFAFIFLAPALYAVHALLTGLSMVIMDLLGVKLGFGFSAGLIDYLINFTKSTRPLLLFPVGIAYFAVYYCLFSFCIKKFNLLTMGREASPESLTVGASRQTPAISPATAPPAPVVDKKIRALLKAVGGADNIREITAQSTRLCLDLRNTDTLLDMQALREVEAFGFARPDDSRLEIILGPEAQAICDSLMYVMQTGSASEPEPRDRTGTADMPQHDAHNAHNNRNTEGNRMLEALGGQENLLSVDACATRLRLKVHDNNRIDEVRLKELGALGVVRPDNTSLQVILGPVADNVASQLREAWLNAQRKQ